VNGALKSIDIYIFGDHFYQVKEEVRMSIEEGKAAPAFTLPDANGKKVSLEDFRGKNVVVYFYPKDDTSG